MNRTACLILVTMIAMAAPALAGDLPRWPDPKLAAGETPSQQFVSGGVTKWVASSGEPVIFIAGVKDGKGIVRANWRTEKGDQTHVLVSFDEPGAEVGIVDMSNGDITVVTHVYVTGAPDRYEAWRFSFDPAKGFRQLRHATFNGKQPNPPWAYPKLSKNPIALAFDTVAYLSRRQDDGWKLYFDNEVVKVRGLGDQTLVPGTALAEGFAERGMPLVPYGGKCTRSCCTTKPGKFSQFPRIEKICFSADKERPKVRELVLGGG
jgi:hypothetical protein